MNQRRRGEASTELVYSEADVADFRERWEQSEKERQFAQQLSALNGRMDGIPQLIESTARRIIVEITNEQRQEAARRRRAILAFVVAVATIVVVLVVPIETSIITHLYP